MILDDKTSALDDKTSAKDKTSLENTQLKKQLEQLRSQQQKQDQAWKDIRKLLQGFLEQEKSTSTTQSNPKKEIDYPQPDKKALTTTPYRVKPGDTLTHIAVKFNIPLACLYTWNAIEDTHLLKVGSLLQTTGNSANCRLPLAQTKQRPTPAYASHKTQDNTQKEEPTTPAPSPDLAQGRVPPSEKVQDWEVISASHKAANIRNIHSGKKSLLWVDVYSPLFGRVEAIDPFLGHVVTASGKINRTQLRQRNTP